jgi:hypothetical protein
MRVYEAKPAVLYAIKCGPFYKVGYAAEIWSRLQTLQCGNPLILTISLVVDTTAKAAPKAEHRAHLALDRFRHRDEWFRAPLHVIRAAMVAACDAAEEKVHPQVRWFPRGRPVLDLETARSA